ncbi:MAG TPA: L-rhamnose mutarotase [Parafilimonas sp.]|nr:L-rhamnose mutarotase [Parafilimonas sp.]
MNKFSFLLLAISMALFACSQSQSEKSSGKLTEKVFVVNIIPGEKPLQEYLNYHQHIWPQVEAGFRKAGYKNIELYRYDHVLVMTVTVPKNADLNAMGKLAESYSPKCAEWNKLMSGYQQGIPGTAPGQKWVEAKSFYQFSN